MRYLGDFLAGSTVRFKWPTFNAAGASVTRATNGSIRIYKGDSDTQRSSGSGITDTEDFDSLTGIHHLSIDLSDDADAGFYAAGNDYQVVLVGAVVDGQTVNAILAEFSIENRSRKANVVEWLGTAVATPAVAGVPEVDVTHVSGVAEDLPTDTGIGSAFSSLGSAVSDVDTAVGAANTALGDLDTAVGNLATAVAAVPAAVWEVAVEATETAKGYLRLMAAVLLGKSSGSPDGSPVFRNPQDNKDRVSATIVDRDRTAVTLDSSD